MEFRLLSYGFRPWTPEDTALVADYGRTGGATSTLQWSGARNGRAGRTLALSSALALGTVLAILVIPEFGPWLSAHLHHHH